MLIFFHLRPLAFLLIALAHSSIYSSEIIQRTLHHSSRPLQKSPLSKKPLNPHAHNFYPSSDFYNFGSFFGIYSHYCEPFYYPRSSYHSTTIPHLISYALWCRKSALIQIMKKNGNTQSIEHQWEKILTAVCEEFSFPFSNLDLSFPSQKEIANTPLEIPYTPEGALKEMQEELILESTSEERKKALKVEIAYLVEFLEDIKKDHPLAYDKPQAQRSKLRAESLKESSLAMMTPPTDIVSADTKVAQIGFKKAPVLIITSKKKPADLNQPSHSSEPPIDSKKIETPKEPTPTADIVSKPLKRDFFLECAVAAGLATDSLSEKSIANPIHEPSENPAKHAAAEKHHLKKLAKQAAALAKKELKIALEEEQHDLIKTACDQEEYASAISILLGSDQTTEWFANNIFFMAHQLLQKKATGDFSEFSKLVITFLKKKRTLLSDEQKSILFVYLSAHCEPTMRLSYLRQAADLKNIKAEAQWLALKVNEQLNNPDFRECAYGQDCIHKKVVAFFALHSENESLKTLLARYLILFFSIEADCPNIKITTPLTELYSSAKRYLSADDYASLLELTPLFNPKETLFSPEMNPLIVTVNNLFDLDELIKQSFPPMPLDSLSGTNITPTIRAIPSSETTPKRPIPVSHSPFTNGLFEIFNEYNKIKNEFKEKLQTAKTSTHKKSITTLLARKKDIIHKSIIELLKTIKTKDDVDHFFRALSRFEVNESYTEVKDYIDSNLAHIPLQKDLSSDQKP